MKKVITGIFWNVNERRLRTLWRLIFQMVFLLLALLLFQYVVLSIVAAIGLASGTLALDEITIKLLKTTFRNFSADNYDLPIYVHEFVAVLASVWLAGRLLDRRRLAGFGLRINKNWWLDFGFGLFLGGFLVTSIFLVELIAGWVSITGVFVSSNPDTPFALAFLFALVMMFMAGIQEELTLRGYQLTNLAEGLNGKRVSPRWALFGALILSSLVFSLLHISNPNSSLAGIISAFMGGILLALGYVLTGELAIPFGLHIAWNFFQANVFGFTLSGGNYSWGTIFATQQNGPDLWVGGAFGPESGLLAYGAVFLGCLLVVLWVRVRRGIVRLHKGIAEPPNAYVHY